MQIEKSQDYLEHAKPFQVYVIHVVAALLICQAPDLYGWDILQREYVWIGLIILSYCNSETTTLS